MHTSHPTSKRPKNFSQSGPTTSERGRIGISRAPPPNCLLNVVNWWVMDDVDPQDDLRSRLARIPPLERRPVPESWTNAAPPVVRAPPPIARPVQPTNDPATRPSIDEPTYSPYEPNRSDQNIEAFEERRRRRWPLVLFGLFLLLALLALLSLFQARRIFDSVERVPVAQVLAPPPTGTNILLVGTDSRSGIDANTENAGVIIGEPVSGARTDTIMVLRIEDDGSKFISLPRDLWLPIDGGSEQRINTAFSQGPEAVITTVQSALGIPLSHYVQVDLAGFIDLVDAVDGVDVTIPYPVFDRNSGLNLPTAGTVTLDSTQALAFVRSRFYTEIRDGTEVVDGTSDLGRVQRQQDFMRALMQKVSAQRNPLVLNNMASAMADSLVIDDGTSMTEALRIADALRSSAPESVVLPTVPTQRGSASVLVLADGASEVLAQFAG